MSAKIVAIEHLSLDGVYQAPGRVDEDDRNGFTQSGWSLEHDSAETQGAVGKIMEGGWSMLAGTTTYDDLYQSWPIKQPDSPMTKSLTAVKKFVVSHKATREMPWANSELVSGEAAKTVAALKASEEKTLVIFGSGVLLRSLLAKQLVDRMLLMIHPIVLGEGYQLFDEGIAAHLRLESSIVTSKGVFVGTYVPE